MAPFMSKMTYLGREGYPCFPRAYIAATPSVFLDKVLYGRYPFRVIQAKPLPARALADIPVVRAATLEKPSGGGSWSYESLVGVLAEVSEETPSGSLSFVTEIIVEAQCQREPVAWVSGTDSIFFPPDLAARGVDLPAVAVIRVGGETDSLTATEWLAGSGAFGLLVVDAQGRWNVSDASLGRIQKLAERNQSAVLFLTRKRRQDPSLGSRISVRGFVTRSGAAPFIVDICTVKDKRSNSSTRQRRQYNGPSGMY
jgi:recombination protein RecA